MARGADIEGFADKLKLALAQANLSRAALAQQVGVDKSVVARILTGTTTTRIVRNCATRWRRSRRISRRRWRLNEAHRCASRCACRRTPARLIARAAFRQIGLTGAEVVPRSSGSQAMSQTTLLPVFTLRTAPAPATDLRTRFAAAVAMVRNLMATRATPLSELATFVQMERDLGVCDTPYSTKGLLASPDTLRFDPWGV